MGLRTGKSEQRRRARIKGAMQSLTDRLYSSQQKSPTGRDGSLGNPGEDPY